jgi:predicted dehydrogenase
LLGQVYLVMLMYSGLYGGRAGQPTDPPEDLDWEMFQGPAPRRQYVPGRQRSWRSFYDYGGGLITDWGVHITDVAHWFMGDDMPRTASAAGQYVRYQPPPREEVPDTVSVSWVYDKFVMNLTSWEVPWLPPGLTNINTYGNIFVGTNGSLYVNRESYALLAPLRAGARGGSTKPVESVSFRRPNNSDEGTINYVRNFLDCVKSRQKTIMDIETAYRSTVPTLLGRLAVRDGKMMAWDGTKASAV